MVDRSSPEFREALDLYRQAPLLELGRMADAERWRLHPENVVTYIIDRNINYTNVCVGLRVLRLRPAAPARRRLRAQL